MNWNPVVPLDRLPVGRAVVARVDGVQVALVRVRGEEVYAVGNLDPFSAAPVMARGIVGSTVVDGDERRTLSSPMYKQAFDLATGRCLVDPDVSLPVWPVRVMDGVVALGDQTRGTLRDAPNEFAQQGAA
ncbi:nitrite reductase small subunit NirD [Mobilicoccus sp.]|uniref:nitrite reductase small subunit NirD n=1 Tax=Mobilicoccus sp. TaxID=2034349 RepID=UPI0028B11C8D|nr:nitrite reductase small subunit NirD [Mobilicoccus sp.]